MIKLKSQFSQNIMPSGFCKLEEHVRREVSWDMLHAESNCREFGDDRRSEWLCFCERAANWFEPVSNRFQANIETKEFFATEN